MLRTFMLLTLLLYLSGCTILDDDRWPAGSGKILLTFDDGPNPRDRVSENLFAVLAKHDVKATFCYVGRNAVANPDIVREAVAQGHDIALHSFNRNFPSFFNYASMLEEIELSKKAIAEAGFERPYTLEYYRPPRGIVTPTVNRLTRNTEMKLAYLSFYIHDAPAGPEEAESLFEDMTRAIRKHNGGAIVLHESRFKKAIEKDNLVDKSWLPDFVDRFITWAEKEGYEFVQYGDAPIEPAS